MRTLAAEAAINYNTVSKVYVNLESDGYVESVRGRGVFVRDIGGKADDVRSIADTEIEGCIRALFGLGHDHRRGHPAHDGRDPPFEGREVLILEEGESSMLNRTAKTEREGRARRATGIEKYNSNVDRRTSQNGPLVFSAFVAVVVFACVLGGGFALTGEFNVWLLWGRLW